MPTRLLLQVAEPSSIYKEVVFLSDLPSSVIEEIENFFISFNQQAGKELKPTGRGGPDRARLIKAAP